jgi:beta-phosphoglucomutase-like phosphatase (HAD superfamily)
MGTDSSAVMSNEAAETTSVHVLLFELEGAAVDGHAKLFEAAQGVFKKAGIKLTDRQFARYCTHGSIPAIIEKLAADLGEGKIGEAERETIFNDFVSGMGNGQVRVHPLFAELLAVTGKRGMRAYALSILPEDAARNVLQKSGLTAQGVELHAFASNERHFPRVDCWMKVSRQTAKSARVCIAVAGCRDSGKSALSSGMRCVVIPNQFTSYQDFSGTDAVLENAEDVSIDDLIDSLT